MKTGIYLTKSADLYLYFYFLIFFLPINNITFSLSLSPSYANRDIGQLRISNDLSHSQLVWLIPSPDVKGGCLGVELTTPPRRVICYRIS